MISYIKLEVKDIESNIFENFSRYQEVTKCWRKIEGRWQIKDISFIDDWTKQQYNILCYHLKKTIKNDGIVMGAFYEGYLKGFIAVEPTFFGENKEYFDLQCIHVSSDMRGKKIGQQLFEHAKIWAKQHGAKKLYISAHSAVETQAFYHAMGCVEACEYNEQHLEKEPFDCQLEYVL